MIASKGRISEADSMKILRYVCNHFRRKYPDLGVTDDCQNWLHCEMTRLQETTKFLVSDHPKAYLKKSLLRAGGRFYMKKLKKDKLIQFVDPVDLHEPPSNFPSVEENFASAEDIKNFVESLTSEKRVICDSVMCGESGKELGKKLGISVTYANQKKRRFLEQSKTYFRSYEYDRN